jgi:hypothetical protein
MMNAWLRGLVGGLVLLESGCGAGKAVVAPAPRKAVVVARSEFAARGRRGGGEYVFPAEPHRFVAAGRWWEVGPTGVHVSTAVDEPVVRAVATAHATFLVGHQGVWLTETFDGPAKRVRYSGVSDEIGVFDDAIVVIDGNRLFRIDARTGQSAIVGPTAPTDPLPGLPALPVLPGLPRRSWFSLFTVRRNVVFLREGRRLFHVAANGSADRWTKQPIPLPFPVYSLDVDATGEFLLVGGGDGSLRTVDATGAVFDGPESSLYLPDRSEPPPKVRRTACDGAGAGEQKAICVLLDDGWRTYRWPGNEWRRDLEGAVAFSDPSVHGAGFLVVARDGFVRLYRLHADGTVTRARHGKGNEYGCQTAPVCTVLAVNRDGTVLLEDGGSRSPGALRSIATNGCTAPRPTLLSPREFHAIGTSGRHVLALSDDGLFEGYFGEDGFRLEKVPSIPLLDAAATFPRWQHASDVTFVCDPEACTLKSPEDSSIRRFWTLP